MRILLLFILLIAQQVLAQDFNLYCSENKISKTFSGSLMSLSGGNFIARNVAENIIEKEIKKETQAKFKIDIENYWGSNILSGDFKSLKATTKSYFYDGLYLSDLNIETICPYNRILYENNELKFKNDLVLKFSSKITKEDLRKILEYNGYPSFLTKINDKTVAKLLKIVPVLKKMKLSSFDIKIDKNANGRLYIQNMKVLNSEIIINGHVVIYKNI